MGIATKILQTFHRTRQVYWKVFEPTILGVRALIIEQEQVMLVKHTYTQGWYLPGGKVDRGETIYTAMCREVSEECGLRVKKAKLSAIYSNINMNRNDHIALFCVDDFEKEDTPTLNTELYKLEIAEVNFFPLNNLPGNITPGTMRRIEEYKRQAFDSEYW
ncbi:MAG: NUDIX domain-containing protein [Acidobacteria bacterium]|nr:NUDIX domain-containing protein [Acidobacteriota bacterium]